MARIEPATDVFDCQTCGACCVNPPDNAREGFVDYVEVAAGDALLRQKDKARRYVVENDAGERHLRLDDQGRCAALLGKLGCKVRCAIYHYRPRACRRVEAGSALCRRYRMQHGIGQSH